MNYKNTMSYALQLSKSKQDAEDLVQESWVAARTKNQHHNPKYITGCVTNNYRWLVLDRSIENDNNPDVATFVLYPHKSSIEMNGFDIAKCVKFLNKNQKKVFDTIAEDPEGTYEEWAKKLGMARRNLTYHVLNIREVFDVMMRRNQLPGKSYDYAKELK